MLPAPYAVFGYEDPTGHQVLAVLLVAATTAVFYAVLRALTFRPADAVPIALLALLFPWASGVRLWPTGSVNNVAVLLLFAGLLVALRGLRVPGPRGLRIHLAASTLLAASVLVYESTTGVALFVWLIYVWRAGWRPAAPRAVMDVCAVAAAAIWSSEHTYKYIAPFGDQIAHIPDILREGIDLVAASLAPVSYPAAYPAILAFAVIGAALAVVVVGGQEEPRGPPVGGRGRRLRSRPRPLLGDLRAAGLLHADLRGDRGPRQRRRHLPRGDPGVGGAAGRRHPRPPQRGRRRRGRRGLDPDRTTGRSTSASSATGRARGKSRRRSSPRSRMRIPARTTSSWYSASRVRPAPTSPRSTSPTTSGPRRRSAPTPRSRPTPSSMEPSSPAPRRAYRSTACRRPSTGSST